MSKEPVHFAVGVYIPCVYDNEDIDAMSYNHYTLLEEAQAECDELNKDGDGWWQWRPLAFYREPGEF